MRVRGGGLSGGVTVKITRAIAWAAATDAGNRSMRKSGRKAWSKEDYSVAVAEFERLWPEAALLAVGAGLEAASPSQSEVGKVEPMLPR